MNASTRLAQHGVHPRGLLTYVISAPVFLAVVMLIVSQLEQGFYRIMPKTFWFIYHDIKPSQAAFVGDQDMVFLSEVTINRASYFHWTDVLRCKSKMGQELYYSDYRSEGLVDHTLRIRHWGGWVYQGERPNYKTTCRLDSTPHITLPYGIEKSQHLMSDTFTVLP